MAVNTTYEVIRRGTRRNLDIRQVRYNVTEWGDPDAPTLVYLHGWGDSGSTFQFVVDALQNEWHVVAPDWRGFGRSVIECSSYWFPDYLADLHALLDVYSPDEPARLVGHSMGAALGETDALQGAEAVEIPNAGHMLHFETATELAAAIEAFLGKHL